MTIPNSYANLKTIAADRMNRTDLTTYFDEAMYLAEAAIARDLRRPSKLTVNGAFAVAGRFTNLPTDFVELKRLTLLYNGERRKMQNKGPDVMANVDDGTSDGSYPKYYCIIGTQLEVAPATASTFELVYFGLPGSIITPDAEAVAFLTRYPDLYLYAFLIELSIRMKDTGRLTMYTTMYTSARDSARSEQRRAQFPRGMAVRTA